MRRCHGNYMQAYRRVNNQEMWDRGSGTAPKVPTVRYCEVARKAVAEQGVGE